METTTSLQRWAEEGIDFRGGASHCTVQEPERGTMLLLTTTLCPISAEFLRGETRLELSYLCSIWCWTTAVSMPLRRQSNLRHAAWKAAVLPLNDARDGAEMSGGGAGRQGCGGWGVTHKPNSQLRTGRQGL